IRDARIEIEEAETEGEGSVASASVRGARLSWIVASAAMLLALIFGIAAVRYLRETPAPPLPEMRVQIVTRATPSPPELALSPNAQYMVFVASGDGPRRLWLRPLDKTDAQPMTGTENAEYPFWSADSRLIGFFASNKLSRVEIGGEPPQALASAPN